MQNMSKYVNWSVYIVKCSDNSLYTGITNDLNKRINDSTTRFVEILALFAAFFTFISINVQIFSKIDNPTKALWFVVAFSGCLGLFSLITSSIIRGDNVLKLNYRKLRIEASSKFFLWLTFIILIILGLSKID